MRERKGSGQTPPPQHQDRQPGREAEMRPRPASGMAGYVGTNKLSGKVALITGGDSGIGRAVAAAFAKEGADVAFVYLEETEDARETRHLIEREGRRCLAVQADIGDEGCCREIISRTLDEFGRLDILVNNAAEQHRQASLEDISEAQLIDTFRSNVFGMFFLTKAALPHMREGSRIINTTSVMAYRGSPKLLDYSATKGAIVAFTRSLALGLVHRGIHVNAVAPGPIWTPLIPATFSEQDVEKFGSQVPMGRPGQPDEVAPCYVFLATDGASYMTGQVLHPNGGEVINT